MIPAPRIEEKKEALKQVRHEVFKARTPKTKQKYRNQDRELRAEIGELLKTHGWSDDAATQIAQSDPYNQNASAPFFDLEWMFGIEDGFDVVIGNPPCVRQEQIKHLKEDFKKQFECFTGTADLYVYFYERGFKLLREHGVLTYISSNKYFRAAYGQKLRQFLATQSRIHQIIDFGDAPVFTVIAYPTIVVTEKAAPKNQRLRALSWEMGKPIQQPEAVVEQESFWMPQTELRADGWQLADDAALQLLERLRKVGTPLREYVNGQIYRGIVTGLNEAFIVDTLTCNRLITEHHSSAEVLKPFLRGRDVKRWRVNYQGLWLIFTQKGIEIEKYPAIKKHLESHKTSLKKRLNVVRDGDDWFQIPYAINYWQEFEKPKIIYQKIATHQAFAWDTSSAFSNNKTFLIPRADLYLLALLNSKLIWLFLGSVVCKMVGGAYAMQAIFVSQIPIFNTSQQHKKLIELIAYYILGLHNYTTSAQDKLMLEYFEQIINGLVYELYLPEDLHAHDFAFAAPLQLENLPTLDDIQGNKLEALRIIFQRLYATNHPIRQNLFALDTIPVIRLIEGKA